MTHKYYEVRREIYNNYAGTFPKNVPVSRTFKMLAWPGWVVLSLLVASPIATILLALLLPDTFFYLIPAVIIFVVAVVFEFVREKAYKPEERNRKLHEAHEEYEAYINSLKNILESLGIKTAQMRKMLKNECKERLSNQAKPFNNANGMIYNTLIGIPLGALVSSIIYQNNNEATVTPIVVLIILGAIIIAFCQLIKVFSYYAEGNFKDKFLLEVLNELEYNED